VIVSLLDIHASPPSDDEPPLEILEVGTGQGSLTLHISRAIHAFNSEERKGDKRRAILHTTDIVQKHSEHAEKVVKGFRHGLYADNVDFHVGPLDQFFARMNEKREVGNSNASESTTSSYPDAILHPLSGKTSLESESSTASESGTPPSSKTTYSSAENTTSFSPTTESSPSTSYVPPPTPFLSHIIIDTPKSNSHIQLATQYLLPDGKIIIFNPSITQIGDCTETIKRLRLPLVQETVLELGQGISGGRVWDVRAVLPRYEEREAEKVREKDVHVERENRSGSQEEKDALSALEAVEEEAVRKAEEEQKFVMVCRPKVGRMIIGGGFVGVWRKTC
jgi:tRNA (adenine57-N1/adenine58-N1)-methyltransferase